MATPPPADDDPDDDLIAYLDGELDDAAAEAVEHELANDPAARARADEHKKAYDLLDYLPKSEPSPTFTNRTLTRLIPTAGVSGSQPTPTVPPAPRRRVWPEVLAWGVLAVLASGVTFATARATRPPAPPPAELPLSDVAVIESLPLYAGVDDVVFLRELHKADLFDADTADAVDPPRRDTLPAADREQLIEQFRAFTPARQQQLRTLHQKLNDPATSDRVPLLHTLEGYAVWLARLPDADRKRVYDAAPEQRTEVVHQVVNGRWREALPVRQQEQLKEVKSTEEKLEALQAFRGEEKSRREEWEIAGRVWRLTAVNGQGKDFKPWPFDQPNAERQVDDYIRNAFGLDPKGVKLKKDKDKADPLPSSCRLTPQEAAELLECHEAVGRGERWFNYVVILLRLSEKYPTLPRPGPAGGKLIVQRNDLPPGYQMPKEDVLKRRLIVGKWPDFALEVWQANAKDGKPAPLGPCKPDEFTPAVREFATVKLAEKLTQAEKDKLKGLEGKWPEYPREVMELARKKNLSVPEVTLPGEPDSWRTYYQLAPAKK